MSVNTVPGQGQTIADRLNAARHSLAGQGLAKAVCKATTEEMIAPKKKHLEYLLQCTYEPNVSIPQLANLLVERSQNASSIVVFKALISIHHLMCCGNERFMQYMASNTTSLQVGSLVDRNDIVIYVRSYAKYLNEKAISYRSVAFDFCKAKRGKDEGVMRTMSVDKLFKTLAVLQNQMDALLEFDYHSCASPHSACVSRPILNAAFMSLVRDSIRLYACYNDAIINLIDKYFDMNKKNCREAFELYKNFLQRMEKVSDMLKVAENLGADKGTMPDLTKVPNRLLDVFEQHLANLEGRKLSAQNTLSDFNKTDEILKIQALAEEEAALERIKGEHIKTNPFLIDDVSAPTTAPTATGERDTIDFQSPPSASQVRTEQILDLFSPTTAPVQLATEGHMGAGSEELLQLSNPFANRTCQSAAGTTQSSAGFVSMFPPDVTSDLFSNPTQTDVFISQVSGESTLSNQPLFFDTSSACKISSDIFAPLSSQATAKQSAVSVPNPFDSTSVQIPSQSDPFAPSQQFLLDAGATSTRDDFISQICSFSYADRSTQHSAPVVSPFASQLFTSNNVTSLNKNNHHLSQSMNNFQPTLNNNSNFTSINDSSNLATLNNSSNLATLNNTSNLTILNNNSNLATLNNTSNLAPLNSSSNLVTLNNQVGKSLLESDMFSEIKDTQDASVNLFGISFPPSSQSSSHGPPNDPFTGTSPLFYPCQSFGQVLQPTRDEVNTPARVPSHHPLSNGTNDKVGGGWTQQGANSTACNSLLSNDLDLSLQSLVQNLGISGDERGKAGTTKLQSSAAPIRSMSNRAGQHTAQMGST